MKMNSITVQVHFEKFYYMEDGGLKCDNKEESFVKVKVDKHSTVAEFIKLIPQVRACVGGWVGGWVGGGGVRINYVADENLYSFIVST